MIVRTKPDRYDPLQPPQRGTAAGSVALQVLCSVVREGARRQQAPRQRTDMAPVEDRLEVQVASCGPAGAAHRGDELASIDFVTRVHSNGIQVVVGGDQAVAVIDLHPVAPAPRMPACCADHSGVRCIHLGSARRGVVLAEMEVFGGPGQGADPETERRTGNQLFQGRP
ncbi:MAG: hypothetical protein JWQ56_962 [Pseudarthrobacter sp.]|nr:hypothetical protein [Pseudarthrobacter sp.]